jgi:menaquinone-dependent protoporphyrinogen oxidase
MNSQYLDANRYSSGHNILVAYSSSFGSTGEVAEAIAGELCSRGATVDVGRIAEVAGLAKYDAVVIGSAIQYDKWMPEAREFVLANQNALAEIPVAYFFCCLTLSQRSPKAEAKAAGYAESLLSLSSRVTPVSVGQFAGVLDYSQMPWYARLPARAIMAAMDVKEGDHRDWVGIRSWADVMCPLLA